MLDPLFHPNQFRVTPQANGRWHVDNSTPGFETRHFRNEQSAIRAARSYAQPSGGEVLVYGMELQLRSIDHFDVDPLFVRSGIPSDDGMDGGGV